MQTPNMADEKLKKLIEIFPNIVTETIDEDGNVVRAIDKDILEQEISSKVVEGREERYQFTWPDKKQSILAANAPISKTLRPCRDESKTSIQQKTCTSKETTLKYSNSYKKHTSVKSK